MLTPAAGGRQRVRSSAMPGDRRRMNRDGIASRMAIPPTQHSGHVLGALGIAQLDFEAAKTDVAARIHRLLEQRRVCPDAIASLLQVRESELRKLFQGRLATCSLEQLLRTLTWLGDDIDILVRPGGGGQTRGSVRVVKTEAVGRTDHADRNGGSESTTGKLRAEPQRTGVTAAPERAAAANRPKLLDKWEVEDVTSLDITTIYRKMKAGDFPKPLRVGRRRVAWRQSDITAWQAGLEMGTRR